MSHPFDEKTYVASRGTSEGSKNAFDGKTQVVRGEITASTEVDLGSVKLRRRIPAVGMVGAAAAGLLVIGFILFKPSTDSVSTPPSPAIPSEPKVVNHEIPQVAPSPEVKQSETLVRRMNKGDVFQLLKVSLSKNRSPAAPFKGY